MRYIPLLLALLSACGGGLTVDGLEELFGEHPGFTADGFDFPVGKPDAKGYYRALKFGRPNRKFGNNLHLGEDWNGVRGGDTDLGDPVYAVASGYVLSAYDAGGDWGSVVRMAHRLPGDEPVFVESVYAHLDRVDARAGTFLRRGERVGTMGNNGGMYYAHLHFELRSAVLKDLGGGYDRDLKGFLDPTAFIRKNRALPKAGESNTAP